MSVSGVCRCAMAVSDSRAFSPVLPALLAITECDASLGAEFESLVAFLCLRGSFQTRGFDFIRVSLTVAGAIERGLRRFHLSFLFKNRRSSFHSERGLSFISRVWSPLALRLCSNQALAATLSQSGASILSFCLIHSLTHSGELVSRQASLNFSACSMYA